MAIHASRRIAALLAILLALGGFTLLVVATDQVDQAAMLAAIGLVCLSVAVYVAAALPAPPSTDDVFESVAWGKFFVAATYAALAIALFAAMTHAPGYARFVHML
jgi:hypothetical protein